MATLMQAFNALTVDPSQSVGSMPVGTHRVIICGSEVKASKSGESGYLELQLEIIDGEHKGTHGAYRLNLYHSNPQTVEIAYRQFSAVCHVVGVYQVQDSVQLHNIPFMVEVGLQKEPNPEKYSQVKRVFDVNGNEPGKQGQAAPAQAPAPAAQPAAAPAWGQSAPQQPAPAWGQPAPAPAAPAPAIANGVAMPAANTQPTATPPWGQSAAPAPAGGQTPPWGQQA